MTRWPLVSLREAPAAVPALAAIVLFVVWATSQAGYPLTHWAPGALIVLVLLAIAVLAVPLRFAEIPLTVRVALACLAAYTALSFLSILWAQVPGYAWEGANRTLLYLMVFALFALWRGRGASAALLLGVWTLALVGVAVYVVLHLDAATGKSFEALFSGERLSYPVGYPNATAAQWLMAFWPALLLARSSRLPWALRGLLAGGAVVLADVALLSLSRGSLFATPVMIVLVFALVPGRLRTFATAVPVALGIGASAPLVLRVGDRIAAGQSAQAATSRAQAATHSAEAATHSAQAATSRAQAATHSVEAATHSAQAAMHSAEAAMHSAVLSMFVAALLVGLVVAAGAAFESRRLAASPGLAQNLRRIVAAVALASLLAVVGGGLALAGNGVGGNPINRVSRAWDSFKGGYSSESSGSNRLLTGLGSNRYDFYRVALDEFLAHPILGIGVDNFQQQYLAHGRSSETPRYPHSVELRTLSQTGLLGGLLALVGLGAALLAGWRAMRARTDPLAPTVAAAALAGFAYWAVHGSFDWFWEFAGLGASAFALLGIACSLTSVRGEANRGAPRARGGGEGLGRGGGALDRLAPRARGGGNDLGVGAPVGGAPKRAAPRARGARQSRWSIAVAAVLMLVVAASFLAPWLSERQIQSAANIWPKAPLVAYARLSDAAKLNPLSDRAYLVEGTIALRFGDLTRAQRAFSLALQRVPGDAYAALELGAIASESGYRSLALALLERAVGLNPRDPLTREALDTVRSGKRVDVEALNRLILGAAEHLA
jgi:tetratricopeptide (TPR) repeat protein